MASPYPTSPALSERMHTWPILNVVAHSATLKSFYFAATTPILPGQFVMLWRPGGEEKPFSVSDVRNGRMEVTIKAVGPFTERLMACSEGERIGLRGPFGNPFTLPEATPDGPPVLVVGGGCGVAPVRFLHRHLQERGLRSTFLVGVRSAADLMFRDDYAGDGTLIVTDDGSLGARELLPAKVGALLAAEPYCAIAAAGPEVVLRALATLARDHGLPTELSFERYMKCGVGVCGECCDDDGLRMCVEGPVLRRA